MKRYDKYKDSGIEWIGEIPEHWDKVRLKNIGFLYSGLSGKSGSDFNNEENPNNKHFINFTNICNNLYVENDNFGLVNIEEGENQNLVQVGDLFFLMSSENQEDVGKSAVIVNDFGELYLNSFCKGFRTTKANIVSEYINYLLNSNAVKQLISIEGRGFTRINLRMEGVTSLPIILPPKEEQHLIATYLDLKTAQIDDLISKKEKLIELLKEERTAMINQAVTKGLDNNVPMKDSGIEWLGEIPEGWEVVRIKHITSKIGSGVTPKGGAEVYQEEGIPLLRSQNVYFDHFKLDNVAYISEDIHNSMENSKVKSGDVLLNITGGSIGRCFYVSDEFNEANVNQHVCIVRPNKKVYTEYLHLMLKSDIGQLHIDLCQLGGNREALNFEQLKNFPFGLPSIAEQEKILNKIKSTFNKVDVQINNIVNQIALLKEYKNALISEVVTGKVKVIED